MSIKGTGLDKKSISNEGVIMMDNNKINNIEEQDDERLDETIEDNSVKATEYISSAVPFSAKNTARSLRTKGIFTLVKAKTGNRAVISKETSEYLQNPNTLQFSYNEDSLIIGAKLPNNNNNFNVKSCKNKSIVYSVSLVREIAEKFQLDFTDRTSMTFDEAEYISYESLPIIVIKIK